MIRLPTYIDRYPAKMVATLADKLITRYTSRCTELLDPFCGSGAILTAAHQRGIPVAGLDINPYAVLLSKVKLQGFHLPSARNLRDRLVKRATSLQSPPPIPWATRDYWFTKGTILKYEKLRYVATRMRLNCSREGRAVLLAYALSVRRCSRADQRSPKPFISKRAIERRKGHHFDPLNDITALLEELGELYGDPKPGTSQVICADLRSAGNCAELTGRFSHVLTSPPYINAQDYFRNFKLELHLLDGLLPFDLAELKSCFIGTERGNLLEGIPKRVICYHRSLLPHLKQLEVAHPWHASIIHRYLSDMGKSFDSIRSFLRKDGVLVVVCGDNLVAGYRVRTWCLLSRLLEDRGFVLFDRFGDRIECRTVPPQRKGHKGLIKQEVISAFCKQDA